MKKINLLTVGNPNSGKTTLFNSLTGSRQQIGNWAGVTVDKKTGVMALGETEYHLTDLPGIYTLENADGEQSLDESIAIKALFSFDADLVINLVDASCLERNLYLTLQLRELGVPMIVILNKMDILAKQEEEIDLTLLSQSLGCPVIGVSANDTNSIEQCKQALETQIANIVAKPSSALSFSYGVTFDVRLAELTAYLLSHNINYSRSVALRLFAGDDALLQQFSSEQQKVIRDYTLVDDISELDIYLADVRYTKVAEICHTSRKKLTSIKTQLTDTIDKVLLNPIAGLPLFLVIMYLMFMFSINIGGAFIDFFDIAVGAIFVDTTHALFDSLLPTWLVTLLADGVGAGIQTVATFIPVIACLYLFMSVLESSGYMARAAFMLDHFMQKIGLPGKAFVPLVLGFGCNVPAIMATRTLDQERERRLAAAMAPFMSCGARLPVYALFAAAFFPEQGQNLVFLLYLLGIFAAVFTGFVLRSTIYKGTSDGLLIEMPRYEIPSLKNVGFKTWHKLKRFIFGAGKTIVIVVTLLNFLNAVGTDGSFGHQDSEHSVLSKVAQTITPVFAPMGVQEDNWQATVGIITGIFAKEAVVGTLNSLYTLDKGGDEGEFNLLASLEEAFMTIPDNLFGINYADPLGISVGNLPDKSAVADDQGIDISIFQNLSAHFTVASAFAYLVFVLLYTPCVAAMGAYVREFGRSYALFIGSWTMLLALVTAIICFQVTMLTSTPLVSLFWISASVAAILAAVGLLHLQAKRQVLQLEKA